MIRVKPFDVPRNINYFSDAGYRLPDTRRIIDKKIPGCGFTEFCIRNNDNVILCVPRVALLENKVKQAFFRGEQRLGYVCGSEIVTDDESIIPPVKKEFDPNLYSYIQNHYYNIISNPNLYGYGCKYITTYDSFRFIREALGEDVIRSFHVVVDEFQIILKDSGFKSDTEQEFLQSLEGLERVCYISATPIPETIIDEMPGFKDIEYEEFNWPDEELIHKEFKVVTRPKEYVKKEIFDYLSGKFKSMPIDDYRSAISRELVIYVNSVNTICSLIRSCGLTYNNTSVLCSKSNPKNIEKLRKAFKLKRVDGAAYDNPFGEVPDGEHNKMFTFCTSAVYSGVDFYSDNARSIVMSCATEETLRDDPVIDIKQIAGRQRWGSNPWRNYVKVYTSIEKVDEKTAKSMKNNIQERINRTERKLMNWEKFSDVEKSDWLSSVKANILLNRYSEDYTSISKHNGDSVVRFNNMVMLYDLYSLHIILNVYNAEYVYSPFVNRPTLSQDDQECIRIFSELVQFTEKVQYLCEHPSIINLVDYTYGNYFKVLSIEKIKACRYRRDLMDEEYKKAINFQNSISPLTSEIESVFKCNEKYSKDYIKKSLGDIYKRLGITDTPKAVNLKNWFELEECKLTEDGKRVSGFKLKKKD